MEDIELIHTEIQSIDDTVAMLLLRKAELIQRLQEDVPPQGVLPEAWQDVRYRQWWYQQHGGR